MCFYGVVEKVKHKLKELREGLGLSREQFAELLGDGWYLRKIERLESGKTRMNEEIADFITKKLGIDFNEMWKISKDDLGQELKNKYDEAPENIQRAIKILLNIED